jgi:acetyltransferase-like isoleucine patch superfamily enzyme
MRIFLVYKLTRRAIAILVNRFDKLHCRLIFWGNNIRHKDFDTSGIPYVSVAIGGSCSIGKNLLMNNGVRGNPIGCYERCTFFVDKGAKLSIGNNLGISQAAIICHSNISIGNNVKIGGGVCIYDTDFHSLDSKLRSNISTDYPNKITIPVSIHDNAFIGAHSLILKGVIIGENSIIGAGSVVTKPVPANQIWAGNPAKFIRQL